MKKYRDIAFGERFKFQDNPVVLQKLRCPNKPDGCFDLCLTDNVIHKAGDLFISITGDGLYHDQEMLTEIDGEWK